MPTHRILSSAQSQLLDCVWCFVSCVTSPHLSSPPTRPRVQSVCTHSLTAPSLPHLSYFCSIFPISHTTFGSLPTCKHTKHMETPLPATLLFTVTELGGERVRVGEGGKRRGEEQRRLTGYRQGPMLVFQRCVKRSKLLSARFQPWADVKVVTSR